MFKEEWLMIFHNASNSHKANGVFLEAYSHHCTEAFFIYSARAPIVYKVDSAIRRIVIYPVDSTFPDSDLSGG